VYAQRLLRPVLVFNPFAELLTFPTSKLRTRRDNDKFLRLINVICFLHQYQRRTKERKLPDGQVIEYIECTAEDYRVAYELLADGVLDNTLDDLPRPARKLLEHIKRYLQERSDREGVPVNRLLFERKDILEATRESFDRLLRINLRGPYFLTQAAARWMLEQKAASPAYRASIIFITSISATVASVDRGEYCISKAGLSMASLLWSARLAEEGISVFEVRPGVIRTDMTAGVAAKYDALLEQGLTLQRRWGTPEDVGRAVAMLARGDLAYSTGQVVMVDGGFSVRRL